MPNLFHRPWLGWLAASLSLTLILGACWGTEEPAPAPTATQRVEPATATPRAPIATPAPTPTPTDQPTTLVLWHSWAEADGDALTAILANFAEQHPQITVQTLYVTENDLPQSYADAVVAGGGPDLLLTSGQWLNDMINAEIVLPLAGLVDAKTLADFSPAALAALRRSDIANSSDKANNNQLYGLPTYVELVSLYYNRSLIDADQLPKTTAGLLDLAQTSPATGSGLYANLYHLAWGFPAFDSEFFGDDGQLLLAQNDGAADFLAWLAELNSTNGSYVDLDYGMLLDRFKKYEFAFFVDGPWSAAELHAALGDDLAVTPLPVGPDGAAQPWLSSGGVFVNPKLDSAQQRAAIQLALHLTNADSGTQLAQLAHRVPANLQAEMGDDPLLTGFVEQAKQAQPIETRPEMDNVWGYGGDMLAKVLNGVSEPGAAVEEAVELIDAANGKE